LLRVYEFDLVSTPIHSLLLAG